MNAADLTPPASALPEMHRRVAAAQAIKNIWEVRPHKLGTNDCVRMVAMHLRSLGYKVKLPPSGSYRTVRSALKALAAAGHADLAAALDAQGLVRIPPAATVAGDIVMLPSADDLGSLAIVLGNGRICAFHEDVATGTAVLQPLEVLHAWRVEPR